MNLKHNRFLLASAVFFCSIQMQAQFNAASSYLPDLSGAKFTLAVHQINFEGGGTSGGQILNYDQIKGSPFWKDDYSVASMYSYDNLMLGKAQVKMNFLTNEVYYLDKENRELVAPRDIISKVIIHPPSDTTKKLTVFRISPAEIFLNDKPVYEYVQELNEGELKLMKLTRRKVGSADSLFGTKKRYFFTSDEYYFVAYKRSINYVKKISKESILSFIPGTPAYDKWIADNKINFKKEEDIVRFFNYYNQQQPQVK